jgi:hypothetical protein
MFDIPPPTTENKRAPINTSGQMLFGAIINKGTIMAIGIYKVMKR